MLRPPTSAHQREFAIRERGVIAYEHVIGEFRHNATVPHPFHHCPVHRTLTARQFVVGTMWYAQLHLFHHPLVVRLSARPRRIARRENFVTRGMHKYQRWPVVPGYP